MAPGVPSRSVLPQGLLLVHVKRRPRPTESVMSSVITMSHHNAWRGEWKPLLLGVFVFFDLTCGARCQGVQIPRDVDYGASGLVQFSYECDSESCSVRCYLHNTMVLEVKPAKSATYTSYRSHNRQNAPE